MSLKLTSFRQTNLLEPRLICTLYAYHTCTSICTSIHSSHIAPAHSTLFSYKHHHATYTSYIHEILLVQFWTLDSYVIIWLPRAIHTCLICTSYSFSFIWKELCITWSFLLLIWTWHAYLLRLVTSLLPWELRRLVWLGYCPYVTYAWRHQYFNSPTKKTFLLGDLENLFILHILHITKHNQYTPSGPIWRVGP